MTQAQKPFESVRPPEQKPALQHAQTPVQPVAPQAVHRHAQINRNGLTPVDLLALQRTVGNRMAQRMLARRGDNANMLAHELTHSAQQRSAIQRQAKPKKDQPPKAQPPPSGGTIAEGGALNDATITAVKDALKKATTKRYIAYKDIVKVGGTLAWRANNPGNLRDAPTKVARVRGQVGKFAVFATMDDGRKAQRDLYLKSYGDMKVRDAVAKLTPPSENDTKQYLKDLQAQGVNLDDTVKSQIDKIMEAVKKNEGMKEGTEVPRSPDQNKSSP
jgi:hypothetical protein